MSGESDRGLNRTKGYIPLRAISPEDGKLWRVGIRIDHAQRLCRQGLHRQKEIAYTLEWALKNPTAIFEGVRRDEDEDPTSDVQSWLCYVAKPETRFRFGDAKPEPAGDRVFLAFMNQDFVVYNWRWEPNSDRDARLPADWEHRFRKRLL